MENTVPESGNMAGTGVCINTVKIPSYTTGDVGFRYETQVSSYRLNVFNVTDKNYWSSVSTIGVPRTIAASASVAY